MDLKEFPHLRLYLLGGFVLVVLALYLGVLYDTQVNDHEDYLVQSIRTITQPETVEGSRGIITDRNGQVLVSNRSTYSLTFNPSLLKEDEDINEAILRLVELCQEQGVDWEDNLPITGTAPFSYTLDGLSDLQRGRFLTYLLSLDAVTEPLGVYLLDHPALLEVEDEEGNTTNPADDILADATLTDDQKASALVEKLPSSALTENLLTDIGISAHKLVELMREDFKLPAVFSLNQARLVLGVRYELELRSLMPKIPSYVMSEDVDTAFISLLSDGNFSGAKVSSSSVREYQTTYGAHILGYTSVIQAEDDTEALTEQGYNLDDKIGRSGVEAAFEEYLRGRDGVRIVSTNSDGKVTGEYYSIEPEPGNTVELTIDLDFQAAVEDALAKTVSQMNADDARKGKETIRGAGVAVLDVDTAGVLALASYPTYDLSTYLQNATELNNDPTAPLYNRATQGRYAPGSTFKPLMAVAALEEGAVTLTETVRDPGYWVYPDTVAGTGTWSWKCWNRSGHGLVNVVEAIKVSCNVFFYEMAYRLGIETMNEYALAFGLGQSTGIEIGDNPGVLAGPAEREANGGTWYGGDTITAGIGQSDNLFTPLQLANYIATLVNGGTHNEVHLLKAVKSYDNSQVLAVGGGEPLNTIDISDSTLAAVKEGMHELTTTGSLAGYFRSCVVDAGAKTGTAQISANTTNNGVFVCFAPYDDPEIALAIVIEKGSAGANLASTAVEILNAYFTADEVGTAIIGENQLLQ